MRGYQGFAERLASKVGEQAKENGLADVKAPASGGVSLSGAVDVDAPASVPIPESGNGEAVSPAASVDVNANAYDKAAGVSLNKELAAYYKAQEYEKRVQAAENLNSLCEQIALGQQSLDDERTQLAVVYGYSLVNGLNPKHAGRDEFLESVFGTRNKKEVAGRIQRIFANKSRGMWLRSEAWEEAKEEYEKDGDGARYFELCNETEFGSREELYHEKWTSLDYDRMRKKAQKKADLAYVYYLSDPQAAEAGWKVANLLQDGQDVEDFGEMEFIQKLTREQRAIALNLAMALRTEETHWYSGVGNVVRVPVDGVVGVGKWLGRMFLDTEAEDLMGQMLDRYGNTEAFFQNATQKEKDLIISKYAKFDLESINSMYDDFASTAYPLVPGAATPMKQGAATAIHSQRSPEERARRAMEQYEKEGAREDYIANQWRVDVENAGIGSTVDKEGVVSNLSEGAGQLLPVVAATAAVIVSRGKVKPAVAKRIANITMFATMYGDSYNRNYEDLVYRRGVDADHAGEIAMAIGLTDAAIEFGAMKVALKGTGLSTAISKGVGKAAEKVGLGKIAHNAAVYTRANEGNLIVKTAAKLGIKNKAAQIALKEGGAFGLLLLDETGENIAQAAAQQAVYNIYDYWQGEDGLMYFEDENALNAISDSATEMFTPGGMSQLVPFWVFGIPGRYSKRRGGQDGGSGAIGDGGDNGGNGGGAGGGSPAPTPTVPILAATNAQKEAEAYTAAMEARKAAGVSDEAANAFSTQLTVAEKSKLKARYQLTDEQMKAVEDEGAARERWQAVQSTVLELTDGLREEADKMESTEPTEQEVLDDLSADAEEGLADKSFAGEETEPATEDEGAETEQTAEKPVEQKPAEQKPAQAKTKTKEKTIRRPRSDNVPNKTPKPKAPTFMQADGSLVSAPLISRNGKWLACALSEDKTTWHLFIRRGNNWVPLKNERVKGAPEPAPQQTPTELPAEKQEGGQAATQEEIEAGAAQDGTPAKARADGFRVVEGIKYTRQESTKGEYGRESSANFGGDGGRVKTRFKIVNAEDVQASHTTQGNPNNNFFLGDAQPKDRRNETSRNQFKDIAMNIHPEEITGEGSAYTGTPIVNERGEVIQGNGRIASLRLMYQTPELAEQQQTYKNYLIEHAAEYGLTKEQVEKMENPVLVREAAVDDATAVRLGNMKAQDTEAGGKQLIDEQQVSALMKPEDFEGFVATALTDATDEDTFNQVIRKNAFALLRFLRERKLISADQYNTAFLRGSPTRNAVASLQGILTERFLQGANENVRAAFLSEDFRDAARRAILETFWLDLKSSRENSILPDIYGGIEIYYRIVQDSKTDPTTEKYFKDLRKAEDRDQMRAAITTVAYGRMDLTGVDYGKTQTAAAFWWAAVFANQSKPQIETSLREVYNRVQKGVEDPLGLGIAKPQEDKWSVYSDYLGIPMQSNNETAETTYKREQRLFKYDVPMQNRELSEEKKALRKSLISRMTKAMGLKVKSFTSQQVNKLLGKQQGEARLNAEGARRKSKTDTSKKAFKERREKVIADFKKKNPDGEVIEGAFHGTNDFGFTTFDNNSSASFVQQGGEGHWFTDSGAMADSYTKGSDHIKRGKVNNNVPFKHSEYVEKLTEDEDALRQEEDGRWRLDRGRGYEYYDSVNDIPLEALKESYEAYFPKEHNGGVYGEIDLFMAEQPLVVDAGGMLWNALPEPSFDGASVEDVEMGRHFSWCAVYKTEDDKYSLEYRQETAYAFNSFAHSYDTIDEVVEKIVSVGVSERAAKQFVEPMASGEASSVGKSYDYTTRDWVEFAFANGFDGVIFENVVDYGKLQGKGKAKPHNVYVVKRADQIKMNDAKAEDDYGNAIPAEQRYDLDNNDIRFSYELKNPDGTVFGWYNSSKGEIWLNDDAIDFDTPIHEFTHAWSDIVEREDPRLANKILDLVRQTKEYSLFIKEIEGDETSPYRGLSERQIAWEVYSRVCGKRGEEIAMQEGLTMFAKLREAIKKFFGKLLNTFGLTDAQIADLTFDECVGMTLRDLTDRRTMADKVAFNRLNKKLDQKGLLRDEVDRLALENAIKDNAWKKKIKMASIKLAVQLVKKGFVGTKEADFATGQQMLPHETSDVIFAVMKLGQTYAHIVLAQRQLYTDNATLVKDVMAARVALFQQKLQDGILKNAQISPDMIADAELYINKLNAETKSGRKSQLKGLGVEDVETALGGSLRKMFLAKNDGVILTDEISKIVSDNAPVWAQEHDVLNSTRGTLYNAFKYVARSMVYSASRERALRMVEAIYEAETMDGVMKAARKAEEFLREKGINMKSADLMKSIGNVLDSALKKKGDKMAVADKRKLSADFITTLKTADSIFKRLKKASRGKDIVEAEKILIEITDEVQALRDKLANENMDGAKVDEVVAKLAAYNWFKGFAVQNVSVLQDIVSNISTAIEQDLRDSKERRRKFKQAIEEDATNLTAAIAANPTKNFDLEGGRFAQAIEEAKTYHQNFEQMLEYVVRFAKGSVGNWAKKWVRSINKREYSCRNEKAKAVQKHMDAFDNGLAALGIPKSAQKALAVNLAKKRKELAKFSRTGAELTPDQVLGIWLALRQDDVSGRLLRMSGQDRQRLLNMQGDNGDNVRALWKQIQMMGEMEAFLRDGKANGTGIDLTKVGDMMCSIFKGNAARFNAACKDYFGLNGMVSESDDYFPVVRDRQKGMVISSTMVGTSIVPNAAIARIPNNNPVSETSGAIGLFLNTIVDTEHFIAYHTLSRYFSALFGNGTMSRTMNDKIGNKNKSNLIRAISDVVNGQFMGEDGSGVGAFVNAGVDLTSSLMVGANPNSVLMQGAGMMNWLVRHKVSEVAKGMLVWAHPLKAWTAIREVRSHVLNSERYSPRAKEAMALFNRNQSVVKHGISKVKDWAMAMLRYGDFVASCVLGMGIYVQVRDGLLNEINPKTGNVYTYKEACDEAGAQWFDEVEKLQQASNTANLTKIQRRGGALGHMFINLRSAVVQMMGNEVQAYLLAVAQNEGKKFKRLRSLGDVRFMKSVFVNHVFAGTFAWLIDNMMASLLGDDDDDEDLWSVKQLFAYMLLGQFSAVPVIGDSIAHLVMGQYMRASQLPVMSLVDRLGRGGMKLIDNIEEAASGEDEFEVGENLKLVVKSTGSAGNFAVKVVNKLEDDEDD